MKHASPFKGLAIVFCLLIAAPSALAQEAPAPKEHPLYKQLKAFALTGGVIDVKGLTLKKDRLQLTLDGQIFLSEPVNGAITGAVFMGQGKAICWGQLRGSLKDPPWTLTGPGKGKLFEVGPIILGHRLSTEKTQGAYSTLIYNKGALVLRMLHFMLMDPSAGDGTPFFNMMSDFVERHRNSTASSDDFRAVVNEHFAKSPIARNTGWPI